MTSFHVFWAILAMATLIISSQKEEKKMLYTRDREVGCTCKSLFRKKNWFYSQQVGLKRILISDKFCPNNISDPIPILTFVCFYHNTIVLSNNKAHCSFQFILLFCLGLCLYFTFIIFFYLCLSLSF
jgi:hypothetical protein